MQNPGLRGEVGKKPEEMDPVALFVRPKCPVLAPKFLYPESSAAILICSGNHLFTGLVFL